MSVTSLLAELFKGVGAFDWGHLAMILVGSALISLAIVKKYEPLLLLPIGFGCIMANLGMSTERGLMQVLYDAGIRTELFPLLIFVGVGAMIDFSPLLAQPKMVLLGAAGQFGIYGTLVVAVLLGFPLHQAAAIGSIGAIDGPTAIFVSSQLAPELLGPIAVAAYSYMSLIPIIQPPVMRLLTTRTERARRMEYEPRPVARAALVVFPVVVTVVVSLVAPDAAPLVATLMLGNLLRESRVVERLSKSAQHEIINVATLLLALTIGATMRAETFLRVDTVLILALGLMAFVLDTAAGLLFGKAMAAVSRRAVNPLIGAAGISAFPMAGRLAARMAQEADCETFILMHAMGSNTAGQLASVIAGGLLLTLVSALH